MTGRGLVTVVGATGFHGHHVVRRLQQDGWRVRGLARRHATQPDEAVAMDVVAADAETLARALAGSTAVVNLVGIKLGTRQEFHQVHVELVRKLAEAMRQQGVRRLVHMSACVKDPRPHAYHRTKLAGEAVVRASGLDWTLLRPSVVWGAGDDFLNNLHALVEASPVLPVPMGGGKLDPVWVEDVAEAVAACLARPKAIGEAYDLGGPEKKPIRHWLKLVAQARGLRTVAFPVPAPLFTAGAHVVMRFTKEPLVTVSQSHLLSKGFATEGNGLDVLGLQAKPLTQAAAAKVLRNATKKAPLRVRVPKPRRASD